VALRGNRHLRDRPAQRRLGVHPGIQSGNRNRLTARVVGGARRGHPGRCAAKHFRRRDRTWRPPPRRGGGHHRGRRPPRRIKSAPNRGGRPDRREPAGRERHSGDRDGSASWGPAQHGLHRHGGQLRAREGHRHGHWHAHATWPHRRTPQGDTGRSNTTPTRIGPHGEGSRLRRDRGRARHDCHDRSGGGRAGSRCTIRSARPRRCACGCGSP
jgi:hypothetical protein